MTTTTFHQSITISPLHNISISAYYRKFINWSRNQEENRLMWLGLALAIHGCVLAPVMTIVVMLAGNNLALYMSVMASMGLTLVTNLAAMPTKITIPVFFLSILIDLGILVTCLFMGFGQSNIF